jgi:diaminohydroxyphosphoribosylaminopyrimidine deaminase/5-amino-6-(5-phosphoribosylamino)uracil reductase
VSEALDRRLMARALKEGRKGRPSPNPHVGAVIARGGEIIAVGHHAKAGHAHAEVLAIQNAADARGATLYCTLEPCNHFGRTPPCTDAIVNAGIARVVIGCADPMPHVPGAIEKLERAGVEVLSGVREDECRELIADFARHRTSGLPYAILKAAITLDGRIATRSGESKWITGEEARAEVHRMRDRADAILVGVGTVIADDPELTVRHVRGRDPVRVVLDTHLRTPKSAKLVRHSSASPTWIVHGPGAEDRDFGEGVELIEAPLDGEHVDLERALEILAARDVVRLLVEGGSKIHGTFLAKGLAQRASIFVAPKLLGDPAAIALADAGPRERIDQAWRLRAPSTRKLGADLLIDGELERG